MNLLLKESYVGRRRRRARRRRPACEWATGASGSRRVRVTRHEKRPVAGLPLSALRGGAATRTLREVVVEGQLTGSGGVQQMAGLGPWARWPSAVMGSRAL